jgi:hypothetical protein
MSEANENTVPVEIKDRWTGRVLFTAQVAVSVDERWRLRAALEIAVKARANLAGAYLADADLARANLTGAKLAGANLTGAKLAGAKLAGADLARAKGLDLPTPEIAAERLRAVAAAALASADALDMNNWHKCETTHCIAGWAIHLAGKEGYDLERRSSHHMAGLQLLGIEAASHFYDTTEDARAWLKSKLEPVT